MIYIQFASPNIPVLHPIIWFAQTSTFSFDWSACNTPCKKACSSVGKTFVIYYQRLSMFSSIMKMDTSLQTGRND